ncbi:hypothetical protein SAMN05216386_1028 [Nitrosospira briensis]|uniref:Uncharacterized protein n=1 Tax=Nitrosospira briensis TaxID=35799 RepID=A0A1I4Z4M6_9PROT|nr:hypothetical protein [Nitrosospira briensis]SFN45246.1 hypothetical protein SAMN05216386_1028 [Nitrosospira briensis]
MLDDLLTTLERSGSDTSVTPCDPAEVTAKPASIKACTLVTSVTSENNDAGNDGANPNECGLASFSHWWRIHYRDRKPEEVSCTPPATYEEIMAWRPEAIAAEPFKPIPRKPDGPLSADDEARIRAWVRYIGETEEGISEVIDRCHIDADARCFHIEMARKVVITEGF